jgi:hypothetical protein
MKIIHSPLQKTLLIFLLTFRLSSCASESIQSRENREASESPKNSEVTPVEKKPPLFLLNSKETILLSACTCKAILQNNEERNFAGRFANILTKEADREFKLTCKGSVNNKSKFKLSNMKVVFHLLSETEYPLYDSNPMEYMNNYILPNKKSNFEIDVLYERGLSIFMKKVAKVTCEIKSIKETTTGEILDESI